MQTVYLETSVISYLASRPSSDTIIAGRQEETRRWWDTARSDWTIVVSELVIEEISAGDPEAASARLAVIEDLPVVVSTPDTETLTAALMAEGLVPSRYPGDAAHIALCTNHEIEYLLTWNQKHLANVFIRRRLEQFLVQHG